MSPCGKCSSSENHPSQSPDIPPLLKGPQQPNKKTIESLCTENDFLGDGSHKLKTYVHRRNKRLSMVLNIIMLGSVITAAGVAIGHIWGAKHECVGPTPTVNKILSNLYKLQEENAYLRNKLKELTLAGNVQQVQQPRASESKPVKQQRCKKVFEEPLDNKVEKAFKCIDSESVKMLDTSELLHHEKKFLNDIGKLKKVYNQNKSWLDAHIRRNFDHENNMRNKHNVKEEGLKADKEQINFNLESQIRPTFKLLNLEENNANNQIPNKVFIPESDKGSKPHQVWNLSRQTDAANKVDNFQKNGENNILKIKLTILGKETKNSYVTGNPERQIKSETLEETASSDSFENINLEQQEGILNEASQTKEKKISYADSLKKDSDTQKVNSQINDSNKVLIRGVQGCDQNREHGDIDLLLNLISSSEDEIKKDDRYTGPKIKRDKKKHDRRKIHKKQKRRNKYEQWEMKGGYMKDFDEFSMTSSHGNLGNDIRITPEKKYFNYNFANYLSKLTEADTLKKPKKSEDIIKPEQKGEKGKKDKSKESEWYDKRYALRAEARRKLEHELFGESSPNNAAWYFRRMNKREQCRAQKDNSTYKKFSKHHQKMNFKMKH